MVLKISTGKRYLIVDFGHFSIVIKKYTGIFSDFTEIGGYILVNETNFPTFCSFSFETCACHPQPSAPFAVSFPPSGLQWTVD